MNEDDNNDLSIQPSPISRFLGAIFPRMPDFYRLLNDQCDLVTDATDVFVTYMETSDQAAAERVRQMEHAGDKLKARNIEILNRSFSTPFDREDIYRAIESVDEGLNYLKTTVREMEILEIKPDAHMLEIAQLLRDSAKSLQAGFSKLKHAPENAEIDATAVTKNERLVEKVYRRAIADLFEPKSYLHALAQERRETDEDIALLLGSMDKASTEAVARGLSFIMEILKRREIYRHLSNTSDHMAHASSILRDIIVKM